jgi:pyruvate,water dikinase
MTLRIDRLLRHTVMQLFMPGDLARHKYAAFKSLLDWDHVCHSSMAGIEQIYHEDKPVDFFAVRAAYHAMVNALSQMIEQLEAMAPMSYGKLSSLLVAVDAPVRDVLAVQSIDDHRPFVWDLGEISQNDLHIVGAKAANLYRLSTELHLPVPRGFVITSSAFGAFCKLNGIQEKIENLLAGVDIESASRLEETSREITSLILGTPVPDAISDAILSAYHRLLPGCLCAVRSSAVGEDTETSFAGQYQTLLDVRGDNLISAYKEVIASKYSPTALSYRIRQGFLEDETPMAVLILEMVRSQTSGVMYTRDPLGMREDTITIYSVPGQGEPLVGGNVSPDVIVIGKERGLQVEKGDMGSLDCDSAFRLAVIGAEIDSHFGCAQDVEWCQEKGGTIQFLQSRPLRLTVSEWNKFGAIAPEVSNTVLLEGGEKAASGISLGRVVIVTTPADLKHIPNGAVLVARTTSPQFAQVAGRITAVITDIGSVAGHFASVAREWGIPTIVNARIATEVLKPGQIVTVDADRQRVYDGIAEPLIAFSIEQKKTITPTPFKKRLRRVLDQVSPLNLIDPKSDLFSAENCKTLHDLLRFVHEKAIQEMFSISGKGKRGFRGARKIVSDIPIVLYVLDLGGGVRPRAGKNAALQAEDVQSLPFSALWKGLAGLKDAWLPDVVHFDWSKFDQLSMGGGIVNFDAQLLASFVLVSSDYLNANIRFGFHFSVIDALITPDSQNNYLSLRFEGGGAHFEGRHLRAIFLAQVLENHGFQVVLERDSVAAVCERTSSHILEEKLQIVGRLLAFTPRLDMSLKDLSEVNQLVMQFSSKPDARNDEIKTPSLIFSESHGIVSSLLTEKVVSYRPTWITDQLAVGHAPMSYEAFDALKKMGINAIVNLCAEYRELYQIEKNNGFDVFYLPVPDDQAPEMNELENALAWLDESIYLGKKVLIHCRLGVGRTGTFLRSYFIRRGFDPETIENRLKRIHSHPTSTSQWRLLKNYGKQSKTLTIRDPSLEVERAVDLSFCFAEYETLCRIADTTAGRNPASFSGDADTAKIPPGCCTHPFDIQLIDAVYLRHHLIQKLSRDERIRVTTEAVRLIRLAKNKPDRKDIPLIQEDASERETLKTDDEGEGLRPYRCPLNVSGECILYDHRPIRCRIFDIPELGECIIDSTSGKHRTLSSITCGSELDELSKELFFLLNGRFLEGRHLIFPVTHVISGKYIEDYFALISNHEKQI